ncbi:hypothetical protein EDC04DRAFT_2600324 [Pisolithus marmoratus]|nr:hypothetical protein EDC04DRAFT_2600324 [Pisolithus marmoratus]
MTEYSTYPPNGWEPLVNIVNTEASPSIVPGTKILMAQNQQGGEKSAPKKSSKAKGKKKATGKDGEGEISGAKKRVTEKKMTHAIKEVKKTSIQEFMEHIWGVVNKATLGYALMTVMDDNDLGTGPTIQHCQVNIQPIDPAFLEEFAKGVSEHGLHNTWQEHAMDVGVHRRDIDLLTVLVDRQDGICCQVGLN